MSHVDEGRLIFGCGHQNGVSQWQGSLIGDGDFQSKYLPENRPPWAIPRLRHALYGSAASGRHLSSYIRDSWP
jgi:hypothetical protein